MLHIVCKGLNDFAIILKFCQIVTLWSNRWSIIPRTWTAIQCQFWTCGKGKMIDPASPSEPAASERHCDLVYLQTNNILQNNYIIL